MEIFANRINNGRVKSAKLVWTLIDHKLGV